MNYKGRSKSNYGAGARKAWATRQEQGWHRKTSQDKKTELLPLAREKLTGCRLALAEKQLTKRYRSKSQERDVIKSYEKLLGTMNAKQKTALEEVACKKPATHTKMKRWKTKGE